MDPPGDWARGGAAGPGRRLSGIMLTYHMHFQISTEKLSIFSLSTPNIWNSCTLLEESQNSGVCSLELQYQISGKKIGDQIFR